MPTIAKVFWSGRSQAVRLPKEFRFEGKEVRITRRGAAVVLEPMEPSVGADDWEWLNQVVGPLPQDFLDALEESEGELPDRNPFE